MEIIEPENPEPVKEDCAILTNDRQGTGLDDHWILPVSNELFEQFKLLRIPERRGGPWEVLKRLGVKNADEIGDGLQYKCPWTDNKYWMFAPGYVLYKRQSMWKTKSNNPVWDFGADFAFAEEFHRSNFLSNQRMENTQPNAQFEFTVPIGGVLRSFLGHGYTQDTLPCDGSGELKGATMQLSNGDMLMGKVWLWYNK